MSEQEFLEALKEELCIEDRDISMNDEFRDYPEWSSLTFLVLVGFVHSEFDVALEAVDLADCITLQDLWNFIQK